VRGGICIRQLGDGDGAETKAFRRFLANPEVTTERLVASWPEQTGAAVAGLHILAIQDSSECGFRTTPDRRRGLGEIGKGQGHHGALLHAMLAVDAAKCTCLGLVGGSVYTRAGRITVPHGKRALEDKESRRWLETAATAKTVLAEAACVTVVADRESDIYAEWATLWSDSGKYIIPIDPDTEDFEATLNYAYDDARMRDLCIERLTAGYSPSAVDAAKTIRTVSRFRLVEDRSSAKTRHAA
jgi:hypothetical protein